MTNLPHFSHIDISQIRGSQRKYYISWCPFHLLKHRLIPQPNSFTQMASILSFIWNRNVGFCRESEALSTQVWEPYHVTIKRNPLTSPEGRCWRLSVWKSFQSHSKSSGAPLNLGQLQAVRVETLWDSSESSKKWSSCQNLSKSKV